ncbi:LOW QUALITY PROTEIN: lebercilin [Neosynchiropus ocellatus]
MSRDTSPKTKDGAVMNDWDDSLSQRSRRSTKSRSRASSSSKQAHRRGVIQGRSPDEEPSQSRTSRSSPDRDHESDRDERRTNGSLYSEDSETLTERSLSPYSCSRSPTPQRRMHVKRVSGSPIYKTGIGRRPLRPGGLPQSYLRGQRSQSKEPSPSKDLDLVTKRMLSARLLKINELRNSLAELQLRTDELQKENRILRQLKIRQEKALQRYDDTESEISKLITQHSNETHALRERLRRTKERERAAERRLKESEEQLRRSRSTIARLNKLVEHKELGVRDELSRKLEEETVRAREMALRVKELERSLELSGGSFQRQLAAERKKTLSVQEEMKTLQGELEQLSQKLKEKERELDTRNIYANRMVKSSQRKEADTKQKISSRSSSKAIQTQDRVSSPDFPSPPPALAEANEHVPDEYLSLKEQDRRSETEEGRRTSEPQKKESQEDDAKTSGRLRSGGLLHEGCVTCAVTGGEAKEDVFSVTQGEAVKRPGHVQGEVERWNQQAAEETRRKKEQLLAKMREIDCENHGFQLSRTQNTEGAIFNLTEPELGLRGRRRPVLEGGATGRRTPRSQTSGEDLAFGGYAPSFTQPGSRGSPGFPSPPPREGRDSALEAIGVFTLRGAETAPKEPDRGADQQRKSDLMQQLFGTVATISAPAATNGLGLGPDSLISFRPSSPPAHSTLRVREGRPAVRAIASYDDDIEEITL